MILNEKDLDITIISKPGLSVDSLSFKRSVLTQKDLIAVYRTFLNTCDLKVMCDFTNDNFYSVLTDSTFNVMFKGLRGCICSNK